MYTPPPVFYDYIERLSATKLNILSNDVAYLYGIATGAHPAVSVVSRGWGDGSWGTVTVSNIYYVRHKLPYLRYLIRGVWTSNNVPSARTFLPSAVNTSNDRITMAAHDWVDHTKVWISSTGTLPGGLAASTDYWVQVIDANTIVLYDSDNFSGSAVNLTSQGTGTHTMTNKGGAQSPRNRYPQAKIYYNGQLVVTLDWGGVAPPGCTQTINGATRTWDGYVDLVALGGLTERDFYEVRVDHVLFNPEHEDPSQFPSGALVEVRALYESSEMAG